MEGARPLPPSHPAAGADGVGRCGRRACLPRVTRLCGSESVAWSEPRPVWDSNGRRTAGGVRFPLLLARACERSSAMYRSGKPRLIQRKDAKRHPGLLRDVEACCREARGGRAVVQVEAVTAASRQRSRMAMSAHASAKERRLAVRARLRPPDAAPYGRRACRRSRSANKSPAAPMRAPKTAR